MARQAKSRAKPFREGSAPTAHEGNTGTRSRARLHQQEGSVTANATDSRAFGNKRQLGQTVPSNHISKKSKLDEESISNAGSELPEPPPMDDFIEPGNPFSNDDDPADKTTGDSGETDDEIEAETMRQTMEAQEVRKEADEEALWKKRGEDQTLLKKLEEQALLEELEGRALLKKLEEEAILKKKQEEQALLKKAEEEALEKKKKEEEALRKKEQEDAIRKQAEEEPDRQQAEWAESAETGGQVTANSEMEVGNDLQGKSQAQTRKRAAGKKKAGKQTARNMTNEEDEEQDGPDAERSNNTNKQAPPEEYHEIPCCNCARDAADGNKTICTIVRSSKVAEKDGKQGIKDGKRGKILASCKNCIAKKLTCQLIKWNRDLEDAGKAIQSTMIERAMNPLAERPSGWPKWTAVVRDKVPRSNPTPAQISSDLTDHKSASNQRIIELEDRVKALEEQNVHMAAENSRMAATIQAIEGRLGVVGEQHSQGYDADGSMNRHTPGHGQPSSFQYPAPGGAGGW